MTRVFWSTVNPREYDIRAGCTHATASSDERAIEHGPGWLEESELILSSPGAAIYRCRSPGAQPKSGRPHAVAHLLPGAASPAGLISRVL